MNAVEQEILKQARAIALPHNLAVELFKDVVSLDTDDEPRSYGHVLCLICNETRVLTNTIMTISQELSDKLPINRVVFQTARTPSFVSLDGADEEQVKRFMEMQDDNFLDRYRKNLTHQNG